MPERTAPHHTALAVLALGVALAATGMDTHAQAWPSRPVRVVVPYGAGGASDGPMRVLAQELATKLGQPFVVENRPGQSGMIGTEVVWKSAPDGHTVLLSSNPAVTGRALYPKLPFDPVEDFDPVGLFGREPAVLLVHPSLPVKTVRELIDLAHAQSGQLQYASSGNGSGQHLFTALFLSMAGTQMQHIPYRGSPQATADLLGGQVRVGMPGLASMVPNIREGKLRALATTGVTRSPLLPEVPTLSEAGVKGYEAYVWNGLQVPRGTPAAIVERLNAEMGIALRAPAVRSFMDRAAIEVITTKPAEFGAFLRAERDKWTRIVRETGAKVE
ncbi:MAG: Bug family tripartite tricarboxylate transporter substrate binding protein [Pseudomonadota bacterium]